MRLICCYSAWKVCIVRDFPPHPLYYLLICLISIPLFLQKRDLGQLEFWEPLLILPMIKTAKSYKSTRKTVNYSAQLTKIHFSQWQ